MVKEVWLHIGTPKSGTTSLQKYLNTHRTALRENGLIYVTAPGRENANELAIASNRKRDDLREIADKIDQELRQADTEKALISSEMLYGFSSTKMLELLPALQGKSLKILIYLRRQDKYIEAMYLQKSKNGRFLGTIHDYIAKFNASGSDYFEMLSDWRSFGADICPRIFEKPRLKSGDVVADAFEQMALPLPEPLENDDTNVTPSYARVQLLQAAARAEIAQPRKLQRYLSARFPQTAEQRGPIFNDQERQDFLDRFAKGNEALRAAYFPDQSTLFDLSDTPSTGIETFTKAQMEEIVRFLAALKASS